MHGHGHFAHNQFRVAYRKLRRQVLALGRDLPLVGLSMTTVSERYGIILGLPFLSGNDLSIYK